MFDFFLVLQVQLVNDLLGDEDSLVSLRRWGSSGGISVLLFSGDELGDHLFLLAAHLLFAAWLSFGL